jgi:hypothetical protein
MNCQNIKEIPIILNLRTLEIVNCQNIKEIPNIQNLNYLEINHCQNITKIPNIQSLKELNLYNCKNITKIPNIQNLQELKFMQCKHFYNNVYLPYQFGYNNIEIHKFYKINQIKIWWKKISYYIKNIDTIYNIIEWIEKKRMHPKSKYFQKIYMKWT